MEAFLGTLFGDQLFFYLGRRHSSYLLTRKPNRGPRLERVQGLIRNYRIPIILGFRFLYGLRTVAPFARGISQVPLRLFIPLNLLGALAWAVFFGAAGYLFGHTLEVFLDDVKRYELWAFILLILGGLTVRMIYLLKKKAEFPQDTDSSQQKLKFGWYNQQGQKLIRPQRSSTRLNAHGRRSNVV